MRLNLGILFLILGMFACEQAPSVPDAHPPPSGLRPAGYTEIAPDLSRIPDELKRVFEYIDGNIDNHVFRLQEWIRQPSISNTGEGIHDSARMVQSFFQDLGCQEARVDEVPMTEWGHPAHPVVYARCDEGAERTLLIYWMYDTMPVTEPERWVSDPFAAELHENPDFAPFPKVLVGRGAVNTKGPQMAQLNAFRAIRNVVGRLPVNLVFVAEGDEERMSIGLREWVRQNADLLEDVDAMYRFGWQSRGGGGSIDGGSEGSIFFNLTTSGERWGKGPLQGDIHGGQKRTVDSPAWRHIQMLNTLVSEDGNRAMVAGFYDGIVPLTPEEEAKLERDAEGLDLEDAARSAGVGRYIAEDPVEHLRMARYGMAFNLDGIFGGNMSPGVAAGAVLPGSVTSKHNLRYVPNQDGLEFVNKIRRHLDEHGYEDVEMMVIGDVPWSRMDYDSDVARALTAMYDVFGIAYSDPPTGETMLGPYWPAYLFASDEVSGLRMPIVGGGAGHGGGSHASNEYWVVEGSGQVYGQAGAEKAVATVLYAFAGLLPEPEPGSQD